MSDNHMEKQPERALEITPQTPVNVNVTIPAGDWAQVMSGLDEMPRKIAQPIWQAINDALVGTAKQLSTQNQGENGLQDELREQTGEEQVGQESVVTAKGEEQVQQDAGHASSRTVRFPQDW